MTSFPVVGTMMRSACGNWIRQNCRAWGIPSAAAASRWPGSTARKPDRTISAKYAAWCRPSPRNAAVRGPMRLWVGDVQNCGPNGMPNPMTRYRIARLYQNSSCRISGTERKTLV